MKMRYLSVCSGIEAATVAWHPLGWTPAAFSEIEPFPRKVLQHHYPEVPLHGDFTTIKGDEYGPIDLLVGGTPCQSFSVAGLRGGLADDRGNLALEFLRLAQRTRARWVVWENVPGVLSSNGGRDFGSILGGLVELGYGFSYRVLDAQYFGVAQRRRRVFVVGYLGDWRPAAAVLFERHSLQGHPPPRREAGKSVAGTIAARFGTSRNNHEECVASTIQARMGSGGADHETETLIPDVAGALDSQCGGGKLTHQSMTSGHVIGTITARMFNALGARDVEEGALLPVSTFRWQNENDGIVQDPVSASLRAKGTTTDERSVGAYVAFHPTQDPIWSDDGSTHAMGTGSRNGQASVAVAFDLRGREGGSQFEGPHDTANIRAASGGSSRSYVAAAAVRRLTPRECERLQGFPDDYTLIEDKTPDGPRYKALGNSMAVPVMRWIGERIAAYEGGTHADER